MNVMSQVLVNESRMHLSDGGSHVTIFLSQMSRDKADYRPRDKLKGKWVTCNKAALLHFDKVFSLSRNLSISKNCVTIGYL